MASNRENLLKKDKLMIFYQPRFPYSKSGYPIRFLKVLRENDTNAVAKVTHNQKKELKVISECKIEYDFRGNQVFITSPGDAGHLDLCKLLSSKGINGGYLAWLFAVEDGNDTKAKENRSIATICFELDPIDEKEASTWTIL